MLTINKMESLENDKTFNKDNENMLKINEVNGRNYNTGK